MGVVLAGLLATLLLAACGSPSSTAAVATTSPSTTLQPTTSYTTTTVPIASPSAAALTCDSPSSWAIHDANGVRFAYPSCWTPVHNVEVSTMSSSLVDLSNEAMQDPC